MLRVKFLILLLGAVGVVTIGSLIFKFVSKPHPKAVAMAVQPSPITQEEGIVLGTNTEQQEIDTPDDTVEPERNPIRRVNAPVATPVTTQNNNSSSSNNSSSNSNSSSSNNSNSSSTPANSPSPTPLPPTILEIFTGGTNVTVTQPGASAKPGVNGQIILEGAKVTTGADTRVQMLYGNGSATRLDSNSAVTMSKEPTVDRGGSVSIDLGRTWNRIKKVVGTEEPFHSDSTAVLATVRGTSYGHSLGMDQNNLPFDKIFTVEGSVTVSCKQIAKEVIVDKDYQALVTCIKNNVSDFLQTINNLTEDDAKWILFNMQNDEELVKKYPFITYFDPNNPPKNISDNLAPIVNAGNDFTITLPAVATLSGTINDDGLPIGWKPLSLWTPNLSMMLSKPHVINNPVSAETTVQFTAPGIYEFTLSGTDILTASQDAVLVTVLGIPNQPPLVDLGIDQTTTLGQPFTINPTVTDDGLPTSSIGYLWTVESGPLLGALISSPLSKNTSVTFTKTGTYTLKLAASDGLLSHSDVTTIIVLPVPTPSPSFNPQTAVVRIEPPSINMPTTGAKHGLSALLYDQNGPVWSGVTYSWGMSSTSSVGTLSQINGNIAMFTSLNMGTGYVFVTATHGTNTFTGAIPLTIGTISPSPTPASSPSPSPLPNPTIIGNPTRTGNVCIPFVSNSCTTNITVNGTNFATGIKAEASGAGLSTKLGTVVVLNGTQLNVTFTGLTKSKSYTLRLFYADGRTVTKTAAFNTN